MKKRVLIAVVLITLLIVVGMPTGYGLLQRLAIQDCKFTFDRVEISDINMPSTSNFFSSILVNSLIGSISGPLGIVFEAISIITFALNLPNTFQRILEDTSFSLAAYIKVTNPSVLQVVIDRADVNVSINNVYLNMIHIKGYTIPAGHSIIIPFPLTVNLRNLIQVVSRIIQNDFKTSFNFDITTYLPTLFGEVPLDVKLTATFYLIPPSPTVTITKGDSFHGYYDVTLTNVWDVPVNGTLIIGLLKDPLLSADNGLINFLRVRLLESIYEVRQQSVVINPHDSSVVAIDYSMELCPNARNVVVALWKPNMQLTPYTLTAQLANFQQSNYGFIRIGYDTLRSIVYYLKRNFGYLGNYDFVTSATVTRSWWEDNKGSEIVSVSKGQSVLGCISLSTNMRGSLTIEVWKDIAWTLLIIWPDVKWTKNSLVVTSESFTNKITFTVDPSQSYGGWPGQCRGYYLKVFLNGVTIFQMSSSYPPRLSVK